MFYLNNTQLEFPRDSTVDAAQSVQFWHFLHERLNILLALDLLPLYRHESGGLETLNCDFYEPLGSIWGVVIIRGVPTLLPNQLHLLKTTVSNGRPCTHLRLLQNLLHLDPVETCSHTRLLPFDTFLHVLLFLLSIIEVVVETVSLCARHSWSILSPIIINSQRENKSVPSVRWPGWPWGDDGIYPEYDVSVPEAFREQQETSDTAWHVLVERLPLYLFK